MHRMLAAGIAAAVLGAGIVTGPLRAQEPEGGDKTLSPYFFVKSDDPVADQLPLKSTSVDVQVAGVIADVTVTQVYQNGGKRPIEAVYVFPASSRAAVYGLKMTIADRTIVATIRKREEARKVYEDAKREGRSASLLEQERPNVFSMNVANIMPGDEIRVELRYTELLVPSDGVYEFMYPTVVGPRYTSPSQAGKPDAPKFAAQPYQHAGEAPLSTLALRAVIAAGMPIEEVVCKTHKTEIASRDKTRAVVTLADSEKHGGNRDFILRYRLAGGQIESGLLLFEGEKENFFLLMVQPPRAVKPEQIPPREYIFVVDVSGSMHGFPLDISKKVMRDLLGRLRPTDYFNVMLFSGGNSVLSERSLPATPENVQKAVDVIDRQRGGGGTELLPALERALKLPREGKISRTMVAVTDGYVSVEKEAYALIREHLNEGNFFAFGIGSSVNRYLIESLARAGMGEPLVVTKPEGAEAAAAKFMRYIESPVLTGVKLDFGGFGADSVEPPSIPDVLAERPVIVFGKWKGPARGTITLTGTSGAGEYRQTFDVGRVKPLRENAALRYLWARHRIAVLSDFNALREDKEIVEEVTRLGLDYNLLTAHTSFVAVDSLVRNKGGDSSTVNQPLPMPEGVSDYAVGASSGLGGAAGHGLYFARPVAGGLAPNPVRVEAPKSRERRDEKEDRSQEALKSVSGAVSVTKIESVAGLDALSVRKIIEARLKDLNAIYAQSLAAAPALKGKLTLTVVLDAAGKVLTVTVAANETGNAALADETVKLLKSLAFPAVAGKDKTEFTVELRYAPAR